MDRGELRGLVGVVVQAFNGELAGVILLVHAPRLRRRVMLDLHAFDNSCGRAPQPRGCRKRRARSWARRTLSQRGQLWTTTAGRRGARLVAGFIQGPFDKNGGGAPTVTRTQPSARALRPYSLELK